jgi:hypothetical protein
MLDDVVDKRQTGPLRLFALSAWFRSYRFPDPTTVQQIEKPKRTPGTTLR